MGVIGELEPGSISGELPKDAVAFAVHYPGYPSSADRAIQTLGGTEAILKARSSVPSRLELRFRIEDPYSHPAFGEMRPCSGLLLKIFKKKNNDATDVKGDEASTSGANNSDNAAKLCADVVATITESYHFNGMADYQHVLAVHADALRRKKHLSSLNFDENSGVMDIDQELLMIVPQLFSPKDYPENLVLRPVSTDRSKMKHKNTVQESWEMVIGPRYDLEFDIKEIPGKINWEDKIDKHTIEWEWQAAVAKLLDQRPIWPKHSLHCELIDAGLDISSSQMKRLLPRAGYTFATGPFRGFWIRSGYDPRKEPESRIYQRLEFRVPIGLRDKTNHPKIRQPWKDLCAFRVFPQKTFTHFQLVELKDDYIQEEIRKPSNEKSCTRATGWFSQRTYRCLLLHVHVKFLSVHPSEQVKPLLKLASNRLEKLKRPEILEEMTASDEDLPQIDEDPKDTGTVEGTYGNEGIAEQAVEEEEDDDEEEEEEEFDLYGTLEMDGSLSPTNFSSVNGPHIKGYLQELLGGSSVDPNSTDNEYQIFEQQSDDDEDQF